MPNNAVPAAPTPTAIPAPTLAAVPINEPSLVPSPPAFFSVALMLLLAASLSISIDPK
jgi:hypothetical protein